MNNYEEVDIELRMTAKQARDFAKALGNAQHRQRIQENPREELEAFGIFISAEFAAGSIVLPDPEEIEGLLDTIPGGTGFRPEPDETCFHVIVWFAGALARSRP